MRKLDDQMSAFNQEGIFEELKKTAETQEHLQQVMSVKDLARDKFTGLRVVTTAREAQRDFKYLCENDPLISKELQDFELYQVGIFHPGTGHVSSCPPVRVCRGLDFQK